MAVPKRRKTRSKRDMRRNNIKKENVSLSTDISTGEVHLRHHITEEGYYRGKKIIESKNKKDNNKNKKNNK